MARASAAAAPGTHEPSDSVLGSGTRIRGRVHGDGSLRVEGAIEGEVRVGGDLEIDEGGSIAGDVEAGALVISGQLTGDAAARGPITIRATARVSGNMGGSEIVLEEGAAFTGRIEAEFDLPAELTGRPVTRGQSAAQAERGSHR
ncbi:MAG: polymer-forming cytoskeletal protein [Polyangiaceae bacterium]|nr:polymer-forming cytoskeletal protein [Polyangiaceae bacterium]